MFRFVVVIFLILFTLFAYEICEKHKKIIFRNVQNNEVVVVHNLKQKNY